MMGNYRRTLAALRTGGRRAEGPSDSEWDMMSDAEEAVAAPMSLKKTPSSKGKLSKALKVAAAVQGALSRAGGKLLQGAELCAFSFSSFALCAAPSRGGLR
jgi:hypothetical protein